MASRRLRALVVLLIPAGCYAPPDGPPQDRVGALEPTSLVLQAVDAGTGSALSDEEMTVRYLVRTPIVFDAAAVDRVSSVEPYEIGMPVAEDELVVEVRLEAASYHRLDTVFSVARGTEAGPLTLRLSPRLDRVAEQPSASPSGPAGSGPDATAPVGEDRAAMIAGDGAFQRGDWLEATEAYQRMPTPRNEMSPYGRAFVSAKVRQGIAHANRSEHVRALEIFEEAVDMAEPPVDGFLRLAQAQCAVGRTAEGRGTLAQVDRIRVGLAPLEQSRVSAMQAYHDGLCSFGDFERAETTRERVRAGTRAMQELNAFVEGARAMSPVPPEVFDAVHDAERRVEEVRRAIGGGA